MNPFQIFLHAPNELPMVRDLGFSVPPGGHSLIGVQATSVRVVIQFSTHTDILAKPHGRCSLISKNKGDPQTEICSVSHLSFSKHLTHVFTWHNSQPILSQ